MTNITPQKPPYIFTYWRPWKKDSDFFESYLNYVKDTNLAKYSSDIIGQYISEASQEQISSIFEVGKELGYEIKAFSDSVAEGLEEISEELKIGFDKMSYQLAENNQQLSFINQNLNLIEEQLRIGNILLNDIAVILSDLLRIPDSEKQRQHHIEFGLKFFANSIKEEDLLADALEEFHAAERLMKQDYFVLHRIGMIYLFSKKHLNPNKALNYFKLAGKYASVESDPEAKRLVNVLTKDQDVENAKIYTETDKLSYLAAESYEKAAFAAYVIGDFKEAVALGENALKYLDNPQNHFMLAKYQVRNGQIDDAIFNVNTAIELLPEMLPACFHDLDLINEPKVLELLQNMDREQITLINQMLDEFKKSDFLLNEKNWINTLEEARKKDYVFKVKSVIDIYQEKGKLIKNSPELNKRINKLLVELSSTNKFCKLSTLEKEDVTMHLESALSIEYYKKEETFNHINEIVSKGIPKIGDKWGGGIVFYVNPKNYHGFIISENDIREISEKEISGIKVYERLTFNVHPLLLHEEKWFIFNKTEEIRSDYFNRNFGTEATVGAGKTNTELMIKYYRNKEKIWWSTYFSEFEVKHLEEKENLWWASYYNHDGINSNKYHTVIKRNVESNKEICFYPVSGVLGSRYKKYRETEFVNPAEACQKLNLNGYTDWFLPSEGELLLLKRLNENVANIKLDKSYWVSSGKYDNSIRGKDIIKNEQHRGGVIREEYILRPIRSF